MAANDVRPSPDHPAEGPAGGESPAAASPGAGPASVPGDEARDAAASPEIAASPEAAADLASADRPSETFGEPIVDTSARDAAASGPAAAAYATPAAPARRSFAPTLLGVIGVVLILLLAANLYTLYNPPGNDALQSAVAEVGTLRGRVAALEKRPVPTLDPAAVVAPVEAQLKSLSDQVTALKGDTASATSKADAAAALGDKVTALQGEVAALPKVDLAPITARLDAIDKRMQPLEAYFNAPKIAEQVTDVRQNGSAAETRAAPQALLAQGILADAEVGGRPFPAPVQALGRLGVDDASLAPLRAVADAGTATQADLLAGFRKIENDLVAASAPVSTGTGGVLGRMLANAQSLVTVTHTGATPGEDPNAVTSRIEADLPRGDLRAALSGWNSLPDSGKQMSSAWAEQLKARLAAADAARAIESKAVQALAATTP